MYNKLHIKQYLAAIDTAAARFNTVKERLDAEYRHLEQIRSQIDLLQAAVQGSRPAPVPREKSAGDSSP